MLATSSSVNRYTKGIPRGRGMRSTTGQIIGFQPRTISVKCNCGQEYKNLHMYVYAYVSQILPMLLSHDLVKLPPFIHRILITCTNKLLLEFSFWCHTCFLCNMMSSYYSFCFSTLTICLLLFLSPFLGSLACVPVLYRSIDHCTF